MGIEEFDGLSEVDIPHDFRLDEGVDAQLWHVEMNGAAEQFGSSSPRRANVTHMSAAASGRAAAHCRVCGDQDHRSRDCPCIQSDEEGLGPLQQAALEMDGVSETSLMRKGYKPTKDDEEMRSMQSVQPLDMATPKRRSRRATPGSPWEKVETPICGLGLHQSKRQGDRWSTTWPRATTWWRMSCSSRTRSARWSRRRGRSKVGPLRRGSNRRHLRVNGRTIHRCRISGAARWPSTWWRVWGAAWWYSCGRSCHGRLGSRRRWRWFIRRLDGRITRDGWRCCWARRLRVCGDTWELCANNSMLQWEWRSCEKWGQWHERLTAQLSPCHLLPFWFWWWLNLSKKQKTQNMKINIFHK